MTPLFILLLVIHVSQSEAQTGSCKDILHGFLSGQLSSALGDYQVGALRKEFQQFANNMEQSMNAFKEKMKADFEKKGIRLILTLRFCNISFITYCFFTASFCASGASEMVLY
jgi:hypothetical protein